MSDSKRIAKLEAEIRLHNRNYYDLDKPSIGDVEYDAMREELKRLSPDSPILNEIGNPTFGEKFTHPTIMGSLDKCHTAEEIVAKFSGKTVVLMPKIDGCSMALHYAASGLKQAATRGDGKVGETVTPNAVRMGNVPLVIKDMDQIEIRGEAYIAKSDFYGIMDQPGYDGKADGLQNPRNAAAGGLRQKDPKFTAERKVRFVAYKVLPTRHQTQQEMFQWLKDNGFETCPILTCKVGSEPTESLQAKIDSFKAMKLPYDTDGVVIALVDLVEFDSLGYKGKYPVGALAYKFETEKASSTVTGIEWNTSRNGRVVPVAIIKPTKVCGSTVSRITMNNHDWIVANDVGIGDRIIFEKANEIIPKIVEVVERAKTRSRSVPTHCPSCGEELEKVGVDISCPSESCPAQFVKLVRHILTSLDVKGIAGATLERMADQGVIVDPEDIFKITVDRLTAAGFGESEAQNMVASVKDIKSTHSRLLKALGIRLWGETLFEQLFATGGLAADRWLEPGWGDEKDAAAATMGSVRFKELKEGILARQRLLKALVVNVELKKVAVGAPLTGKSFCITGTLTKKRDEIQDDIRKAGGLVKSSVGSGLGYLVAGEDCGSKLEKAEKLGVKVISEKQLYEMIG